MHVTIRGKRWKLEFEQLEEIRGYCEPPDSVGKRIVIGSDLEGKELLEVIIHELIHSAFWHIDEETVTELAIDISQVLWRLGYRRNTDDRSS